MPKNTDCDHRACCGEPCRMLTPEELEPGEEDIEYARKLIAEGWKSTSNKYRSVAKRRIPLTGKDIVRPEMWETEEGKRLIQNWDNGWAGFYLRSPNHPDIEHIELSVKQYRAFKKLGGETA